jgi:transcription elongation factor Elf1
MMNARSALSKTRRQLQKKQLYTLADFETPITLRCDNCQKELPGSTPIDVQQPYVIAHCVDCGNMTPFKLKNWRP